MPTCRSFACDTHCNGYWSGCRNYGCVDYAPMPVTDSIVDTEGVCVHDVTTICTSVSAWSNWVEVPGVSDGSGYSTRVISTSRSYLEATGGSEANVTLTDLTRHVEDLRFAINEERARRLDSGQGVSGVTPVVWSTQDDLDSSDINEMVTAINQIRANWINDVNPIPDQPVLAYHVDRIRKQIEGLRKDCISNSVCAPNTTCSCYCHCNCHYSDRRLKRNIRSL
jgi:hypothetical protein